MRRQEDRWVRVKPLTQEEKAAIGTVNERFIADILKPRFMPEIRPTASNYPVDIFGKWRGSRYSFNMRYRSGFPDSFGAEFHSGFARLDHVEDHVADHRFDVMWHRHTGQWFRRHASVTLEEALRLIETDGLLHPVT